MLFGNFQYRCRTRRQQGYMMLVLMLIAALIIIGLAAELPKISSQLQRDRENELIHRGAQYARAIKKFYKKTGSYPLNLDQLQETNHIRFLRQKYKDPITGKDFKLLHLGDVQLSLNLPGMTGIPGNVPGGTMAAVAGSLAAASNLGAPAGSAMSTSPTGPTGSSGSSSNPSPFSSPGTSPFSSPGTGQTFGGGPIVGVASTSDKKAFHIFNNKDHYKDWQFFYSPTLDTGALITGPYNGIPLYGGGKVPGAVSPGQMQGQSTQGAGTGQPTPFGQNPTTTSPFGQNPTSSPFGRGPSSSPFGQQ